MRTNTDITYDLPYLFLIQLHSYLQKNKWYLACMLREIKVVGLVRCGVCMLSIVALFMNVETHRSNGADEWHACMLTTITTYKGNGFIISLGRTSQCTVGLQYHHRSDKLDETHKHSCMMRHIDLLHGPPQTILLSFPTRQQNLDGT